MWGACSARTDRVMDRIDPSLLVRMQPLGPLSRPPPAKPTPEPVPGLHHTIGNPSADAARRYVDEQGAIADRHLVRQLAGEQRRRAGRGRPAGRRVERQAVGEDDEPKVRRQGREGHSFEPQASSERGGSEEPMGWVRSRLGREAGHPGGSGGLAGLPGACCCALPARSRLHFRTRPLPFSSSLGLS